MKIQFGMSLSTEDPPVKFIDLVKTTERAGFASIWLTDSGLNGRDCYPYLTLMALNSEIPSIGTGVTNFQSRHLAITANSISSVDEISGGRAILGLSAGGPWNLGELGIKAPISPSLFKENVMTIKKLLAGKKVNFNPKSRDAKLYFQTKSQIPVYVAATGPKMLGVAGEVGEGVIVSTGVYDKCIKFSKEKIEEGAQSAGKDFNKIKLVNWTFCGIAKDSKSAVKSIRPLAMWSPTLNPFWASIVDASPRDSELIHEAYLQRHNFSEMTRISELLSDEFILKFGIAGTVDECIDQIK
ncbi:MAG: LLM class flavin-dependent oxidoreductase, partial [Thaumarchaeota archaeon]|nr:LLM class flavin-dependent oxidoreductase [Nitrososphaerota archaeon]